MEGRKHGQIIPRGEGKWLLRWFVGKVNGKRKYASEMFEGTFAQARKTLASKTAEVTEGRSLVPSKQTVRQYIEWWLDHVAATDVTAATLNSYRARMEHGVFPTLGDLSLQKLSWQQVQALYNTLRETKSARTVQYTHTVLKAALNHAVKGKLLRENPCSHARPGSKDSGSKPAKHEDMQVWKANEVQVFLDRIQKTASRGDYPLWHTLLQSGLRPGEALGLKWSDLEGDRLQVQRTVAETAEKGTFHLEAPKTKRSRRSVALTEESVRVLAAHRKAQAAEILKAGDQFERNDFVFPADNGSFQLPPYVARRWKTSIKRVNKLLAKEKTDLLRQIRLYDTRHTHATLLLLAGVNPKVVSERLGHASVVITLDTYSHVLPDMQEDAVSKLSKVLGGLG
jgi:integrase